MTVRKLLHRAEERFLSDFRGGTDIVGTIVRFVGAVVFVGVVQYYWTGNHGIVTYEGKQAVRREMLNSARVIYPNAAALLRAVVDSEEGRDGYALVHFVRPPGDRESGIVDIEARDREWLAPLLLDAAKLNATLVTRNIIHMIGDQDIWAGLPETDPRTLLERVYKLQRDKLEAIFGSYSLAVLELIAQHDPEDDVGRSAVKQARKLLAEIQADSPAST